MNPSPRLLIIEDEALVADDLAQRLTRLGFEVTGIADNAGHALTLTLHQRPDLILGDIRIKGPCDGIQAVEQIRRVHDVPVVFLTAHADNVTLQRAKTAEPFGYVLKPYTESELRAAIEIAITRHAREQCVRHAERLLHATLCSIGDAVIAADAAGRITFMNTVAEALTGYTADDSLGCDLGSVFLTYDQTTLQPVQSPVLDAIKTGRTIALERDKTLIGFGGERRPIDGTCAPIRDEHGRVTGGILVFRDVSERKRQDAERERLIVELQTALASVKTLAGLLPICAWCKNVRDDQGCWQHLELYLTSHSDAELTHSICPVCVQKFLAE